MIHGFGEAITYGIFEPGINSLNPQPAPNPIAYQIGKAVGNVGSVYIGGYLAGGGAVGGTIAAPTGVGAIAGYGVMAYGATLVASGGIALDNLSALVSMAQNNGGQSGGSGSSDPVDEILRDATFVRKTMGGTTIYEKSGGFDQANRDFNSLDLDNVHKIDTRWGEGRTGRLQDGSNIDVRPGSKASIPTLEIIYSKSRRVKIRYGD